MKLGNLPRIDLCLKIMSWAVYLQLTFSTSFSLAWKTCRASILCPSVLHSSLIQILNQSQSYPFQIACPMPVFKLLNQGMAVDFDQQPRCHVEIYLKRNFQRTFASSAAHLQFPQSRKRRLSDSRDVPHSESRPSFQRHCYFGPCSKAPQTCFSSVEAQCPCPDLL